MSSDTLTVTLGDRTYPVVEQRIAYLRRRLPKALAGVGAVEFTGDNILETLGDRVYDVLCVFFPQDFMPRWEFEGFPTEEAWQRDQDGDETAYDEDLDCSPRPGEVKAALRAALEAHGDLWNDLKNVVGPGTLRALVNQAIAQAMEQQASSTSAPMNGDSARTGSSTSGPTSPGPTD
jgi:hypothetical protein